MLSVLALLSAVAIPAFASRTLAQKKELAAKYFDTAEQLRGKLESKPAATRTEADYKRVIEAYRRVYYVAPTSVKADPSVFAVAELLLEEGRAFKSPHALTEAIGQYEFLRKEYPGSKYRVRALLTIAEIYKDDLGENARALETLKLFMKRYSHTELMAEAQEALKDAEENEAAELRHRKQDSAKSSDETAENEKPDLKSADVRSGELKKVDLKDDRDHSSDDAHHERRHSSSLVTGVRHWSTPDYTRVAVDLENDVKYDSGRIPHPDRIYFDLKDTRLSSQLQGKSFDVDDGYLKRIRIAQFAPGLVRVVLEVNDDVSEYSAFLLPNPYRLVIDIHRKPPATLQASKDKTKPEEKHNALVTAKAEQQKIEKKKPEKKEEAIEAKAVHAEEHATKGKSGEPKTVAKASEPVKKIVDNDSAKPELVANEAPPERPSPKQEIHSRHRRQTPNLMIAKVHEAQPTSDGDRSLIRALGLKIGRIVIDAGHGGHDTGTIGPDGLREKDVVLDVALRLGKLLQTRLGADVIYTRDDDTFVPLETRTAIANQQQADLFISIHANSSRDPSARGVETYYLNFTTSKDALEVAARENAVSEKSIHELQDLVKKIALKDKIEESRELASDVEESLHAGLAKKNPAIRDRGVKQAPFIVLIGANMPSILAEISFISNPTDEHNLEHAAYRQKIAEALYRGIAKYASGLSGIKVAAKMANEPGN